MNFRWTRQTVGSKVIQLIALQFKWHLCGRTAVQSNAVHCNAFGSNGMQTVGSNIMQFIAIEFKWY